MEFMANEAKNVMSQLSMRLPKRLVIFNTLRAFGDRARLRKATIWLHELHGDPITGKTKREYREELGFGKQEELGDEGAGLSEDAAAGVGGDGAGVVEEPKKNPELEIDVTIENLNHRGMPLTYLEALSDVQFSASTQTVKLNVVVIRWEVEGTHSGRFLGVPPTGRRVSLTGITWIAFEDTRNPDRSSNVWATDEWTYWDLPSVMEQIGASP
jgi:predicted ester cyclase